MADTYLLILCQVLGASVMVTTIIYKMPQIFVILDTGSSEGVSLPSVSLEWIAYSIMLTYQFAMEYPLHTYMENTVMVLEDFLLTVVILRNRNMMDSKAVASFFLYSIAFTLIAMRWLPDLIMILAIGMTTPILCWSKIDQLVRILVAGDPGNVSALTWLIASYDTGVRILTTLVITGDIPMLINLTSSEVFNVSIFASIILLRPRRRRRPYL